MKQSCLLLVMALLLAAGAVRGATDEGQRYGSGEFAVDLFGSGTIGEDAFDKLSGTRIEHDVRLGAGVGLSYFITRHVGVGAQAFSESLSSRFVDNTSLSVIFRLPIGNSGFAPYVFGGGGRQFDPSQFWNAHLGGGLEYRFSTKCGVFVDARYVAGEGGRNFGEGRGGVRFLF